MRLYSILFFLIPLALSGQRYISGQIINAIDGEPITGVEVFLSGTTIGTTTDLNGNYRLKIPGEGTYRLTVSHVGYQSVFEDIEPGNKSLVFNTEMEINELSEVVVAIKNRVRQMDVNLFWSTLLGVRPSKRMIHPLNPEDVHYYYNSKTRFLKVTCRVPLIINNYETGYQIRLQLENFTHDYNTSITSWKTEYMFNELEPTNDKQREYWDINRQQIYRVSMDNFLKSLFTNTYDDWYRDCAAETTVINTGHNPKNTPYDFMKSGYLLTYSKLATSFDSTMYEIPETFLSVDSIARSKILYIPAEKKLILVCYGRPLVENDLATLRASRYSQKLFAPEPFRQSYIPDQLAFKSGLFRIMIYTPEPVRIFPDGTYNNVLYLSPLMPSNSITGFNMKLPLDYKPGGNYRSIPLAFATDGYDPVEEHLFNQLSNYPQEKLHLHTDRDIYIPGEKIWFKAYLVDAQSHSNTVNSQYVYAELISPADTLVNRVMITQNDGLFYGHLPLPDDLSEGNYTLRAYTRYMENLGDDYFFKKNIKIGRINNYESGITNYESINRGNNSQSGITNYELRKEGTPGNLTNPQNPVTDYDVSFYPEGGNLLEGVLCKVAFKSLSQNGYPEPVSGTVIDESGVEIATVQTYHAGMGVFNYQPESGRKYYLQCRNADGNEKRFELPQPVPNAYSLNVSVQNNRILLGVEKSIHAPDILSWLLVHCRGDVLYYGEWDDGQKFVSFDKEEFPAGVIQAVLFDAQLNPLSERLIFSKNNASTKIAFQTDKDVYQIRDKVITALSIPDSLFNTQNGHFSVAITDDKDMTIDESATILSSLLLSSELRGYIENPAYYLHDPVAMDLLMMSHGWRRYNIPEVVKGHLESPQIPFQEFQLISGHVSTTANRSGPVRDAEVLIMMQGEGSGVGVTSSDRNGLFVVPDLVFPSSTTFYLRALTSKGSDNVKLVMDDDTFPALVYALQSPYSKQKINEIATKDEIVLDAFIKKAEQRAKYDEDLWTLQLAEVEVTAPKIKKDEPRLHFWANSSSDATITRETIEKLKLPLIANYLALIGGVRVVQNPNGTIASIYIRGSASFSGNPTNALTLVDGFERDISGNALTVNEIESIDVFKGPSAAAFGTKGINGVVSITTRRGRPTNIQTEKSNNIVYTPLGYQKPIAFYSPKYETLEARQSNIPDYRTTIYWKPDVVISDNEEKATFEFYTSDYSTTYSVVIEGLTDDGRIVRQVEKIRVQ